MPYLVYATEKRDLVGEPFDTQADADTFAATDSEYTAYVGEVTGDNYNPFWEADGTWYITTAGVVQQEPVTTILTSNYEDGLDRISECAWHVYQKLRIGAGYTLEGSSTLLNTLSSHQSDLMHVTYDTLRAWPGYTWVTAGPKLQPANLTTTEDTVSEALALIKSCEAMTIEREEPMLPFVLYLDVNESLPTDDASKTESWKGRIVGGAGDDSIPFQLWLFNSDGTPSGNNAEAVASDQATWNSWVGLDFKSALFRAYQKRS